jgi:hypothetical protein
MHKPWQLGQVACAKKLQGFLGGCPGYHCLRSYPTSKATRLLPEPRKRYSFIAYVY